MKGREKEMKGIPLPVCIKTSRFFIPTIDMYYPMVVGLKDLKVQQKINYSIKNVLFGLIYELQQPDMVTYITGSYEMKTNERNVLSITLIGLGDFKGAHPMTIVKGLTVDIETGKVYELKDLFKPNSNYTEILSDIIYKGIKERDISLLDEFKGIRPNQDYYIADKSLIIYFQLYEITAYVYGFPYFVIPIYEIEDIIKEDGILSRMLPFL